MDQAELSPSFSLHGEVAVVPLGACCDILSLWSWNRQFHDSITGYAGLGPHNWPSYPWSSGNGYRKGRTRRP